MTTLALWILMNASIIVDWGQTRNIATSMREVHPYSDLCTNCGKLDYREYQFDETGPASIVLGSHPHRDKVDAYFVGALIANNGVMIALPKKYRPYYAGTVAAIETYFVVSNSHVGIRINF